MTTTEYPVMDVTVDAYGEITNSDETYSAIAYGLDVHGSVIVGWTDGDGTHYDILFAAFPEQFGTLQGGMRGSSDLFVSIMRKGAFGFKCDREKSHPSYIAEKLGLAEYSASSTVAKLADLINGVRRAVHALQVPS